VGCTFQIQKPPIQNHERQPTPHPARRAKENSPAIHRWVCAPPCQSPVRDERITAHFNHHSFAPQDPKSQSPNPRTCPSPSQSESVRPLSATNPPIQRQVAPSRSGAHLSNPKTRNQAPKTLHLWLNCFVPAQEFCSAPPRFSAVNVGLQPFIFAFLVVVPNPVDRDWAMDFARQIH